MLVNRTFWTIFEHYQQLQDQLAIKKESFFFSSSSSTISPSILQKPSLSLPPFSLSLTSHGYTSAPVSTKSPATEAAAAAI